jgi:DNA-binding MarR family transcriptional regulator
VEERVHGPAQSDVAAGLVQLSYVVQAVYARISARHELTPVQAKLLCVLLAGPRGMAELAHCLGVEKAALTGLVDRVERRGFAKRSAVPGDRRALHVSLTEAGGRASAAFHAEMSAELDGLVSSLAEEEREPFGRALAEILAACRNQCPDLALGVAPDVALGEAAGPGKQAAS